MKRSAGPAVVLAAALFGGLAGCRRNEAPPPVVRDVFTGVAGEWVDLGHPFGDKTIYWPGVRPFRLERHSGESADGVYSAANRFSAPEHGGTHLDAPAHFAREGATVDRIDPYRLIGPAVVVDVSARMEPDSRVRVEDFQVWEAHHGRMPDRAVVLIRTGWSDRWPDRTRYLGTADTTAAGAAKLHFPGIAPDAARWLVENREPGAVGIDTPSLDAGQATDFPVHQILLPAGIPGMEGLAHLDALPESGAFVVALPMDIEGGSGAPLRIFGFVPHDLAPEPVDSADAGS